MNKGFTLVETLVTLTLVMLGVLFNARITVFALQQARQSGLRFRMLTTGDDYKNHLASLSFSAPELADGAHRQPNRELTVSWRVETAEAGLKRVRLRVDAAQHAVALEFFKSKFIQEVKK